MEWSIHIYCSIEITQIVFYNLKLIKLEPMLIDQLCEKVTESAKITFCVTRFKFLLDARLF